MEGKCNASRCVLLNVELILMLLRVQDAAKGHVDKRSSSTFT